MTQNKKLTSYLLFFKKKKIPATQIMIRSAATGTQMAVYFSEEDSWIVAIVEDTEISVDIFF